MARPFFALEPADERFLDTAPTRFTDTMDVPVSAEQVWADLTSDDTLSWCRMVRGVTWTSPRPLGVGTTRTVRIALGLLAVHERYFRWEEGRQKSFYVFEASAPGLFRRFAEDYVVEPTGPGTSRFTWTVAVEPKPLGKPGAPLNKLLVSRLFRDTRRHFGAA